jgi:hypothetical protein
MNMPASDEINEQNIDKILNYLRIFHPERATPEFASVIIDAMAIDAHLSAAHGIKVDFEKTIEEVIKKFDQEGL